MVLSGLASEDLSLLQKKGIEDYELVNIIEEPISTYKGGCNRFCLGLKRTVKN